MGDSVINSPRHPFNPYLVTLRPRAANSGPGHIGRHDLELGSSSASDSSFESYDHPGCHAPSAIFTQTMPAMSTRLTRESSGQQHYGHSGAGLFTQTMPAMHSTGYYSGLGGSRWDTVKAFICATQVALPWLWLFNTSSC